MARLTAISDAKPDVLPVIPQNIPDELKAWPQWVVWRLELVKLADGTLKWDKPPRNPRLGALASSTRRETWAPYEDALAAYQDPGRRFDGIGFCLSEDDPFVAGDHDDVMVDGRPGPEMEGLLGVTYSEISPSGSGIRQLVRGALPDGKGGKNGHHEVYDRARYVTITGQVLGPVPVAIAEAQGFVDRLCELARKQRSAEPAAPGGTYVVGQRGTRIRELFGRLNSEGLSLETVLAAINDENVRHFDPPKTEGELREEVTELWARYRHQNGQGPAARTGAVRHTETPVAPSPHPYMGDHGATGPRPDAPCPPFELGDHGATGPFPDAPNPLAHRGVGASVGASGNLPWQTARAFFSETAEKAEAVWDGYVYVNAITELDAKVKHGKTTLLAHLVSHTLDGTPFLNRPTKKGPVVWLTEEGHATFREALAEVGLLEREDLHILAYQQAAATPWSEIVPAAFEEAARVGAVLLVIDTFGQFARLLGDRENSSGAALEALEPVVIRARDSGLAVLMSRHDRRIGGEVGDSARGSSQLTGSVDMVLQLVKPGGQGRDNVRELHALGRFRGTPPLVTIELTEHGYVFASGGEAGAANPRTHAAVAILMAALPNHEQDAISLKAVADRIWGSGFSQRTLQRVAEEMTEAGQVQRRKGEGNLDRSWLYWQPAPGCPRCGNRAWQAEGAQRRCSGPSGCGEVYAVGKEDES